MSAPGAFLAGSLADALEQLAAAEAERAELVPTFREFLEHPDYAGPYMAKVGISPIVGAIVDASEGSPVESIDDETAEKVFRLPRSELPLGESPRVVIIGAGRQSGKTSNLLAPKAVHAAWTQAAPTLRPGQVARVVIISPRADQSKAAFRYCKGIIESSPRLSRNVVKNNEEVIMLRRPDGHLVEIVTGAADSGGTAARSASLLFAGLDESCFFYADDGHTVNDRAIFDAAMGTVRMLAGAQVWLVSTPWIEGTGLMEELIAEHWGVRSGVLVAARVSSYALRGIPEDGSLREETDTDETYAREVLAQPMPAGSAGFFSALELARAVDRKPPGGAVEELGAGGDFAFERDASAVAVVERYVGGFFAPTVVEERHAVPGEDRAQTAIVRELGAIVAAAGAEQILVDSHRRKWIREHMHEEHIAVVDTPGGDQGKAEHYAAFKRVVAEGRLCLGALPRRLAEYVRNQLRSVTSTPISGGKFRISAPRTKRTLEGVGAGRIGSHGDAADALVKAAWQAGAGRFAASWEKPKVAAHVGAASRQAALRSRVMGASASLDYLRQQTRMGRPMGGDD